MSVHDAPDRRAWSTKWPMRWSATSSRCSAASTASWSWSRVGVDLGDGGDEVVEADRLGHADNLGLSTPTVNPRLSHGRQYRTRTCRRTCSPPPPSSASAPRRRWPPACRPAPSTRSWARTTSWRRASRCGPSSRPTPSRSVILWGRPAPARPPSPRLIASPHQALAFERLSAVSAGVKDVRDVPGPGRAAPRRAGRAHDPVPRRGPPFQQDPAGRPAAPGVETGLLTLIGATTENPYFEAQRAPPVPQLAVPPAAASTPTATRPSCTGAWTPRATADDDALDLLADQATGDGRQVLTSPRGLRHRRSSGPRRRAVTHRTPSRRGRPRHHRPALRPGRATTTSSPPSSRASAAATPTPPSTTWPACSRPARTPASSPAACVILASEDIGMADPMSPAGGRRRGRAVEFVGLPRPSSTWPRPPSTWPPLKSNSSATAIWQAREDASPGLRPRGAAPPPGRPPPAEAGGRAGDYDVPPRRPRGWVEQQYLADAACPRPYYEPLRPRRRRPATRRALRPQPPPTARHSVPRSMESRVSAAALILAAASTFARGPAPVGRRRPHDRPPGSCGRRPAS